MKNLLVALLSTLGFAGCGSHDSPEKFTQTFVQHIGKAAPHLKITVRKPLELALVDEAGKEQTMFLDNSYTAYRANPKDKKAIIQRYAEALLETGTMLQTVDKNRITPVIKDRPWISEIREEMKARGATNFPENVFDELNEDLVVVYAEDSPKNLRFLNAEDLASAGVKKEEIRSLAIRNLKKLLPPIKAEGGNGVFMFTAGGDYEASLILFDDIWKSRKIDVKGEFVVAVPSRDVLLVTGTGDPAGIAKLKDMVSKISSEAPYRISPHLYVFKDGKFERFRQ